MSIQDDTSSIEDKMVEAIEKYEKENLRPAKFIIVNGYSYQRIVDHYNKAWETQGLSKLSMCSLQYQGLKIASTGFLGLEDSIEAAG